MIWNFFKHLRLSETSEKLGKLFKKSFGINAFENGPRLSLSLSPYSFTQNATSHKQVVAPYMVVFVYFLRVCQPLYFLQWLNVRGTVNVLFFGSSFITRAHFSLSPVVWLCSEWISRFFYLRSFSASATLHRLSLRIFRLCWRLCDASG